MNIFNQNFNIGNLPYELKSKISNYYASPELTPTKNSKDFSSLLKKKHLQIKLYNSKLRYKAFMQQSLAYKLDKYKKKIGVPEILKKKLKI